MHSSRHIFKWLRDGASRDLNVDGTTPVVFEWVNDGPTPAMIHRLLVFIRDTGTFDAELYGNGVILTNGILVRVVDEVDAVMLDLLDGEAIHTNSEWQALSFDFSYNDIGTGDNTATIRWTFAKSGDPIRIYPGWKLQMTVRDNLVGLVAHTAQIQGVAI